MTIRVVLQSVEKAAILVDNAERFVSIGCGVIVYVAFLNDVEEDALLHAVKAIVAAKAFRHNPSGGPSPDSTISLLEYPVADILIVPQASLGGKLKGRNIQFHSLVDKSRGRVLYEQFCQLLREARGVVSAAVDSNGAPLNEMAGSCDSKCAGRVINGTYGNRQGLRIESEGPFTHLLDF